MIHLHPQTSKHRPRADASLRELERRVGQAYNQNCSGEDLRDAFAEGEPTLFGSFRHSLELILGQDAGYRFERAWGAR